MPRATSCWRMRSPPTPAASGTKRPARSWTKTVSGTTWAAWKRPTPRCFGGSRRRLQATGFRLQVRIGVTALDGEESPDGGGAQNAHPESVAPDKQRLRDEHK